MKISAQVVNSLHRLILSKEMEYSLALLDINDMHHHARDEPLKHYETTSKTIDIMVITYNNLNYYAIYSIPEHSL